jgi:hypothetical protein
MTNLMIPTFGIIASTRYHQPKQLQTKKIYFWGVLSNLTMVRRGPISHPMVVVKRRRNKKIKHKTL